MQKACLVNLRQVVDLVDGVALLVHGVRDHEETHIGRFLQHTVHLLDGLTLDVSLETPPPRVDLANSLLKTLFERASDSHNLADTLHSRSDFSTNMSELGEIPLGDLRDNVVQRRLEASGGGLRNGVRKCRQSIAESNLGSGVGQRVTGSLRRESTVDRRLSMYCKPC